MAMAPRPHRLLVALLLALATVTAIGSIAARWSTGQLLSRPGWGSTSHRLIADGRVRRAVASFAVDQAFGAAGIDETLSRVLPAGLARSIESRLHRAGADAADAVLSSRPGREAFQRASRQAQGDLIAAVDAPGARRSVVLDLTPLLRDVVGAVAGTSLVRAIPGSSALLSVHSTTAGRLVVLRPGQLQGLRTGVRAARTLSWALPAITLALFALALLLGYGWRARVLSQIGYALVLAGAAALALRAGLQYPLSTSLVGSAGDRPAVRDAWMIGTSDARSLAILVLGAGAVLAVASWGLRAVSRGGRRR
jgi:hypothetical protein